jgi:hypothetical protein
VVTVALTAAIAMTAAPPRAAVALAASPGAADSIRSGPAPTPIPAPGPEVSPAVHYDVSPPLRDLVPTNVEQRGQHQDLPRHELSHQPTSTGSAPDPVAQTSPVAPVTAPTVGLNFDGIGVGFGSYTVCCAPPDPNGAVGPNHFVEIVNLDLAVFSKTGGVLLGPVANNTLWQGFGGACQTHNDGDGSVLYDQIADRWVISQFAVNTNPSLECVAVSQTPDPTGTWFRYSFSYGANFPDYPKLGVWPDAYYATFNMFSGNTFLGARACAYDRARMLNGAAATQQCFNTSSLSSTLFGGVLPSSLDGSALPPAGSPNYMVGLDAPATSNLLQSWKFHVDWTTPPNSTFTGPTSLAVASYTNSCSTVARGACIPQGGTAQTLESLADRAMYRLAYRNFGDHAALVVNHTIEVGSGTSLHSGVRWYELRPDAGANLTVFQQGTYAPDTNWRWMGSAAMDQAGNIALGYSVSGSGISPQIHFSGRLAGDAVGTMTQGENVAINGTGSQTGNSLARWGDYTSMAIDPVDGCTFWYTNEYLKAFGSFNWSTRVTSFRLPGCPATPPTDFTLSASPASQTVTQGSSTTYSVSIARTGGFAGAVTLAVSGTGTGASGTFSPNPTTGTTSTLTVTTTASATTGTFPLTITGTSGSLTHQTSATLVVASPPDFTLSVSPTSRTVTQGSSTTYSVTVTPSGGFAGAVTLSVSGTGTGASGAFSPNPATTTSTLTVTTTASATTGTFSLTITGTSGSLTHTTPATLVVSAATAPTVATFDDLSPTSRFLNGQYPTGDIDWGTNQWWLSGPFGRFTTNSISSPSSSMTSGSFTFLVPRILLSLDAYNGGAASSTVTIACAGNPTRTQLLAAGQLMTLSTGWTTACSPVTLGSSNGWDTNFDNVTYRAP